MPWESRSTGTLFMLARIIAQMAALGAVMVGPLAAAPPASAPDLDHFRCYGVATGHPGAHVVQLHDQFDDALDKTEEVLVGFPIGFCNPVAKTVPGPGQGPGQTTDIRDPDAHLTLYEIHETSAQRHPTWKVTVDNQFGRQTLFAGRPVVLAVPTHKAFVDGVDTELSDPQTLDHFKCYRASGRTLDRTVTLADQFETEAVVLAAPLLFCNPVAKTVRRGSEPDDVPPILNPEAHLTCYTIELVAAVGVVTQKGLLVANQFNQIGVDLQPLTVLTDERVLCVPSHKAAVLGMPGSFKAP
jgi:hypothetical protein